MASAKLAPILSDMIGSIGPDTFSHTRTVLICKEKSYPGSAHPFTPSASQIAIRSNFDLVSSNWNTLSAEQVHDWNALAATIEWYNKLGDMYHPSGQQLYVSCNFNMLMIGESIYDTAPVVPVMSPLTSFSALFSTDPADSAIIDFTGHSTDTAIRHMIFASISSPIGRSYAGNLYRFVDYIPESIDDTFDFTNFYVDLFGSPVVSKKIFCKLVPIDKSTGFADRTIYATGIVT